MQAREAVQPPKLTLYYTNAEYFQFTGKIDSISKKKISEKDLVCLNSKGEACLIGELIPKLHKLLSENPVDLVLEEGNMR